MQLYDVEHPKKAATAVANPDGSKYGDHQLCGKDWDVVRESTYILSQHATVIDLLQVTSEPTVSQVLPVIGGLTRKLEPGHTLKYGGASVYILNTDVQDARKRFANDLIKRCVPHCPSLLGSLVPVLICETYCPVRFYLVRCLNIAVTLFSDFSMT